MLQNQTVAAMAVYICCCDCLHQQADVTSVRAFVNRCVVVISQVIITSAQMSNIVVILVAVASASVVGQSDPVR